jgi:CheY-like chemotaxis protein
MKPQQSATKWCIIADDVRASRELLCVWLEELHYECALVGDGEAAKTLLADRIPQLIVTDIEMPRCNGLALLAAIRSHENEAIRRIPVVVISSLQDEKMTDVIKKFGGNGVICKPLERLRVRDMVFAMESGQRWVDSYMSIGTQDSQVPQVSPKLRRMAEDIMRDEPS